MRVVIAGLLVAVAGAGAAPPARAQAFQPPAGNGASESVYGFQPDLYAFSVRGGIDITRPAQWVIGTTLDVAEMWSPRVRLRPSLEVSSEGGDVHLHWSAEVVYRFEPDAAPAIPYLGLGAGHMTNCPGCVTLWPTVVMGFELRFRPSFNWLFEYHALDRLGRHRFLIGLATRTAGEGP